MEIYFFRGTLPQLKAELSISNDRVRHGYRIESSALHIIDLGWPIYFAPFDSEKIPPKARGTIFAIEEPGDQVRLQVELDSDTTLPEYDVVHQRWQQLREILAHRLFEKQPEVGGELEKYPLLFCNQWLIQQYFDKGQRKLGPLKKTWEEIRETKDCKSPANDPIASMRATISVEKKRRNP